MALKLSVFNPYNDHAEYINIIGRQEDKISGIGHITIAIWKDEKTRNTEGKQPVGVLHIATGGKEQKRDGKTIILSNEKVYGKTYAEIYAELKTHSIQWHGEIIDFAKAEDLL